MKTEKLIETIEKIAPPGIAAKWDKSGIQCFSEVDEIYKLAVCLDPVPAIVKQAIDWKAQFILSHHPLTLDPGLPDKNNNYFKILKALLAAEIWLYSAHTSLDANPEGPVKFFGEKLGLHDLAILEPIKINDAVDGIYGFGLYGILDRSLALKELLKKIADILDIRHILICGPYSLNKKIKRIGYCPGSGSNCLSWAIKKNCDIFITGDMKYHTALETVIPVIDVGHHSMEEKMMFYLYCKLKEILPEMEINFFPSISPIHFVTIKNLEPENE